MFPLIVLFALLNGGFWLDVPFSKQPKDGCGAASVWMVMEYWNQFPDALEEIHGALYSRQAGGVYAADMERYFIDRGFRTFAFAGDWSDLAEHVARGQPLVVSIESNSRGTPLHYVVVAGVLEAQQAVLLNDPARRKLWPMSRAEFEKRWSVTDRWTLLAVPEQPLEPADLSASPDAAGNVAPVFAPTPELEEASAAFRAADYGLASRLARRAVDASPYDPLANELVATLFYLDDNLEAAVKYWNRIEKPRIREIDVGVETEWDPILLDRAMGLARGDVLQLGRYQLARKRLDASGAFSAYHFDLDPTDRDEFNLSLRTAAGGSLHPLGWLRGLPYQTIHPEVRNIRKRAIHVQSLWRWDVHKRRIFAELSAPVDLSARFRIAVDSRDEEWEWNGKRFRLWRREIGAGIQQVATSRLNWSSGAIFSRRSSGDSLRYQGSISYEMLRIPERRFVMISEFRGQVGKILSGSQRFSRLETGVQARWSPLSRGKDYEISARLRAGRLFGLAPFDELFALGMDRDHDLWMRAHPGIHQGRKGAGLIGRQFVLWNSEISKSVLNAPLIDVRIVPFADAARVEQWFVDTGIDVRISLGALLTFSVSVGRDLEAGRTAVFTNVSRTPGLTPRW